VRAVFADGSELVLEDVEVCLGILRLKQRLSQQSSARASSQRLFLQADQRPEASYGEALGDDETVETALAYSGSKAELHLSVWVGQLEWQALVEVRDALNYEGWTKNKGRWDTLEEHNDPRRCAGVAVGEGGNIIKIDLESTGMRGALPESIGNLQYLAYLSVEDNEEGGREVLPESIGQLSSLKELFCSDNNFTELPQSIGELSSLEELLVCDNKELKALPSTIGELSKLEELDAYGCALSGAEKGRVRAALPNCEKVYL
jgi:hypothetical protein